MVASCSGMRVGWEVGIPSQHWPLVSSWLRSSWPVCSVAHPSSVVTKCCLQKPVYLQKKGGLRVWYSWNTCFVSSATTFLTIKSKKMQRCLSLSVTAPMFSSKSSCFVETSCVNFSLAKQCTGHWSLAIGPSQLCVVYWEVAVFGGLNPPTVPIFHHIMQ